MTTRMFHIGTVLSIATGRMLSISGMKGIYEILNHMTADVTYTHQIPRVLKEVRPYLLRQHPWLAEVDASGVTPDTMVAFLAEHARLHGKELPVEPLPEGEHYSIDPLSELAEMVHPNNIIVIKKDDS